MTSMHHTQYRNEMSCYTKSVEDLTGILKRNVGYMRSVPFEKILADVDQFLNGTEKMKSGNQSTLQSNVSL